MRQMSFSLTKKAILTRTKTVTRRFAWWWLAPGDLLQPVEKNQGIPKGGKVVYLGGPIRVISTRMEPLSAVDEAEVILEGLSFLTPAAFVRRMQLLFKCSPHALVNRIEFEYV